ncbi:MAG: signal recognition particle subunit SRP19/SEC65 family protein [Candidatus Verstraetearchaeota archaeon]|nr:signal recognition particle subunit SRP19/SEC65 family protein [Candidatus Verstraetearchaeota archaeon]
MKREGSFLIWPVNIDSSKTRSEGRVLPKDKAVDSPTAEEILDACRELSYDAELEGDKRYPALWWGRPGRVAVRKKGNEKKRMVLLRIASSISKKRSMKRK